MSKAEDVLYIAKDVRYKKVDGSLYVMPTRIGWIQDSHEQFAFDCKYSDVKVQKISPPTKETVKLQLCLVNGDTHTFEFVDTAGREKRQSAREAVKELLQQLLPQFKTKISSELEEKNKQLRENPILLQLYKLLVVGEIMSADEFWSNVSQNKYAVLLGGAASNTATDKRPGALAGQAVGVSPDFLSGIVQSDGCNGVKYTLTQEKIQSIFRAYPSVEETYRDVVPDKLTENQFWTLFVQSHYVRRDQVAAKKGDIFDESRDSSRVLSHYVGSQGQLRPEIDLGELFDKTLPEGFGATAHPPPDSAASRPKTAAAKTASVNSAIVRRFNLHSACVLDANLRNAPSTAAAVADAAGARPSLAPNSSTPDLKRLPDATPADGAQAKKARLAFVSDDLEMAELQDAERSAAAPSVAGGTWEGGAAASAAYWEGVAGAADAAALALPAAERSTRVAAFATALAAWQPDQPHALRHLANGDAGGDSLRQLMSGRGAAVSGAAHGTAAGGASQKSPLLLLSDSELAEFITLVIGLKQLLNNFWSCCPPSSALLEQKLDQWHEALRRYECAQMNEYCKKYVKNYGSSKSYVEGLYRMLQAAYAKHAQLKAKRQTRRAPPK